MKALKFLRSYFLIIIMLIAAVTVGVLISSGRLDVNGVINAVRGRKLLAVFVLLGFFMLKGVAVCIPLAVICAGAAIIFGAGAGLLISLIGTALCISESYLIGRYSKSLTLDGVLENNPKFRKYFNNASKYGFTTCFTIHCFQWSTEVQGVLFGLLRTKYPAYLAGSMLALLPSILCYVFIGDSLNIKDPLFLTFAGLMIVEIILGIFLTKRNIIDS